tara:strand:- start:1354 stop:1737 length:384 start_codon:yes stop_codon:yes gene_type:complete
MKLSRKELANMVSELVQEVRRGDSADRRGDMVPPDRRKPLEEEDDLEDGEKPDFPDVDGDGDKDEPITQAQKQKKEKDGDDKEDKGKKDHSKMPPQLRKAMDKKNETITKESLQKLVRQTIKELIDG